MSDNSDGITQPGSSSQPPLTETITSVSAQIGQGDVGAWNFDNIEVRQAADKGSFLGRGWEGCKVGGVDDSCAGLQIKILKGEMGWCWGEGG